MSETPVTMAGTANTNNKIVCSNLNLKWTLSHAKINPNSVTMNAPATPINKLSFNDGSSIAMICRKDVPAFEKACVVRKRTGTSTVNII